MDYKQKYKEALTLVESIYPDLSHEHQMEAEAFFPELKESEDELTWLTKYIEEEAYSLSMDIRDNEDRIKLKNFKRSLAWLEKQGELIDKLVKYREWLISKTEQWTERKNDKTNSNAGEHCCIGAANALISARDEFEEIFDYESWFEKQGEKKETLCDKCRKEQPSHSCQDITANGRCYIEGMNTSNKVKPKFKVKYAGNEYNVLEVKDIAGVTFYGIEDEPNHIDYVLPDNCEIISGYGVKEKGSPYPTKSAIYTEQKPTWSEEDMSKVQIICMYLNEAKKYYADITEVRECINWLKSLKDRVIPQSKQEWSEEDERNLQGIIDEIEANKNQAPDYDLATYDRFLSWLKSLKPQNHWKPSDEQMRAVIDAWGDLCCRGIQYKDFDTLINDLKKL